MLKPLPQVQTDWGRYTFSLPAFGASWPKWDFPLPTLWLCRFKTDHRRWCLAYRLVRKLNYWSNLLYCARSSNFLIRCWFRHFFISLSCALSQNWLLILRIQASAMLPLWSSYALLPNVSNSACSRSDPHFFSYSPHSSMWRWSSVNLWIPCPYVFSSSSPPKQIAAAVFSYLSVSWIAAW